MRVWIAVLGVLGALVVPARAEAAAAVCSVYCDTRDPSLAGQETFPVPELRLNGRRVVLHVSDVDGMAWGSIDDGQVGDAVWLDRTWDGGPSWDGLLGKASIPSTWTGTRTLMYNLADPAAHRRGMIRACGDAQGVACTAWAHARVCDAACDGTDPATAVGDSQPVPETTLGGRRFGLHVDTRGLAWATLANGRAGDEVWLDRSWDEGASWPGGSSLGRTSVPAGATTTRTTMVNTRDPRSRLYGGAVRACGRAVEGANGSCTAWARPATDRAAAAADALLYGYRPDTAWWPSSWWNSAVAVTTLMDWMGRAGRTDLRWVVDRTFEVNRGTFPAGVKSSDPIEGNFISRAIDDAAWWGLAWVRAYDLTGERKYLDMAVTIGTYVHGYWDTSRCGGGVWWDRERTYKNAVTNGLYIRLAAALHNRLPGDATWLARAGAGWQWFRASGMINGSGLVNDGITTSCVNNGQTVWTYNQGLAIGAALELWRATGDGALLTSARQLADAAIASPALTRDGVLTEPCDPAGTCDDNQKQFKGVFMRYFGELAAVTGAAAYATYAQRQAAAIWSSDRDPLNRIGLRWAGGTPNPRDWRTQASGLSALLA
ncbi:glycoside hydrolase family 76 protein [Phytohabitans sp. ZYX-F-186]|uniref:Glycoside hydrolase family 76 protein n=1 Tax=Phytohabitans maris TaxID=3071409 RepID=A0ABU0ZGV8_9ACTN|nr:glycoside hydrolase family 76 protein [Phytohabitans sp. ZYX-F-186]MDQ7906299.1 glycoside hydrolase family 76 protein [Phytohabitans sp. ZYX-F-186]